MDNQVRNIAPFINNRFLITSKWWAERVNPVTGVTEIHRGLDIATSESVPVYSILKGQVHSKGYDDSQGNWIVIKDPISGYASLYMHLMNPSPLNVGDNVEKGDYVGIEGATGDVTGIHLHVEMQNLNLFNNIWHWSYNKQDYIDPTSYMGIDNIEGTWWIYDGQPSPVPADKSKKHNFKWVLYARRIRNKS